MTGPFDRFLDDAAVFPPGEAPLDVAVAAHVARRDTALGRLVGPLVVPAAALPRLVGSGVRVAVVADAAFPAPADVTVVSVETRRPAAVTLPPGASLVVETALDRPLDVPDGALVKLRTGGPDASWFPSPDVLAGALAALVRAGRPFKLTAGLHRAVRGVDPDDGRVHHGFGNVLLAVDALLDDPADVGGAVSWLAQDDVAAVGASLVDLGDERLRRARTMFTSFGTCSVDLPTADLALLGLVPGRTPA